MKTRAVFAASILAGAFLLSGCGDDAPESGSESLPSSEPASSTTTSATASETTTPAAPPTPDVPTLAIGKTYKALEVEVTVTKVEGVDLGDRGDPGFRETVEAYVRTCTPSTAGQAWEMNVFQFAAITKSGRVIPVGTLLSGVREPTYPTFGQLPPGRCQEGWAQIGMDDGEARTVTSIEWQPTPGVPEAAWEIKRPLTLGQPDY